MLSQLALKACNLVDKLLQFRKSCQRTRQSKPLGPNSTDNSQRKAKCYSFNHQVTMMRIIAWLALITLVQGIKSLANSEAFENLGLDTELGDLDYYQLRKYSFVSSIAYCAYQGLVVGQIGAQNQTCPSRACKYEYIKDVMILKRFDYDNLIDVGNGFIAVDPHLKLIYVGFKGTSSKIDWVNNLNLLNTIYKPQVLRNKKYGIAGVHCAKCKVHRGFYSFIRKNGEEVIDMIVAIQKKYPDYKIKLTGHSLGGALALLTGIELRLLGYDAMVITLASPKVGNPQFARFVDTIFETSKLVSHIKQLKSFESHNNGYIRMVHRHDLIPFVPLTKKYTHAGFEYYLSGEGSEQTPPSTYRRGIQYIENERFDFIDIIKNWRRIDHSNYFMPVTTCSHI